MVNVESCTTMCDKCYSLIYDHMAKVLQHDDISKLYYREKSVKRILPELTKEMERMIKKYPNCLHDASFIYSDFVYIAILLVENGFVRRYVGPHKIEITNPITKAKEWFAKKFLELTNCLSQIHNEHSPKTETPENKEVSDLAAEFRQLAQEQKKIVSGLRIHIPTIQVCVQDDYDGLYS